jgi:hypothetical protein
VNAPKTHSQILLGSVTLWLSAKLAATTVNCGDMGLERMSCGGGSAGTASPGLDPLRRAEKMIMAKKR